MERIARPSIHWLRIGLICSPNVESYISKALMMLRSWSAPPLTAQKRLIQPRTLCYSAGTI